MKKKESKFALIFNLKSKNPVEAVAERRTMIIEALESRVLFSGAPAPEPPPEPPVGEAVQEAPENPVGNAHADGHDDDHHEDEHDLHGSPVAGVEAFNGSSTEVENVGIAIPGNSQGDSTIWAEINYTQEEVFSLHSNEGAAATVYLDFNGHVTSGTWWNQNYNNGNDFSTMAFSTDADRSSFSQNDLRSIHDIWLRVSEDFAPFDVNITTEDPGVEGLRKTSANDNGFGVRVVVGPNNGMPDVFQGAGGIAFLNTFDNNMDVPAFSFNGDGYNNPARIAAMTVSHEIGHTLGLSHDGLNGSNYHPGSSAGGLSWGPLMGASFSAPITQWSDGGYAGATETQDDLQIITTYNSFSYKVDDYGDSIGQATALNTATDTGFTHTFGLIEQNTDSDYFSFFAGAGDANIIIAGQAQDSNLDILAEILDENGNVLFTSDQAYDLNARFDVNFAESAEYFLRVTGTGQEGLYDDYGSLGTYYISGTTEPFGTNPNPNTDPVAGNDNVTLDEDASVIFDVLANDSDVDGDPLTIESFTQPTSGTLTSLGEGRFSYSPSANFNGSDSFTYRVSDGKGGIANGLVQFVVNPVNDAPVIQDINEVLDEDTVLNIPLGNFVSDVDDSRLTLTRLTNGQNGTVTFDGQTGFAIYQPNENFNGTDSFIWEVRDAQGAVTEGVINVVVSPVNDSPEAQPITAQTNEDNGVAISISGFVSDVDDTEFTITGVGTASNGAVSFNAETGFITYIPNANYFGTDTFSYTVSDPSGATSQSTVTVNVLEVDDGPSAEDLVVQATEDTNVTFTLANSASDPEGGVLTLENVTGAANGTVQFNEQTGIVTYIPNANFFGVENLTYIVADSAGNTAQAGITINIASVNDIPVAQDIITQATEDTDLTVDISEFVTDVEDSVVNLTGVGTATNGVVTFDPKNGTLLYSPGSNFNGTDTFTYEVTDSDGAKSTGEVTVSVASVNDLPNVQGENVDVDSGSAIVIDVLANDGDVDGDLLSIASFSQGALGSVAVQDGNIVYTANSNTSGQDTFTYTVSDGNGGLATAVVAVEVNAVVTESSDPNMNAGMVIASSEWQTIQLDSSYDSMVVVATPVKGSGQPPVVARIQQADDNSFQLKVQRLDGQSGPVSGIEVQYLVVEEGVYTVEDHGIKLEAVTYDSSLTDGKNNWQGERQTLTNSYDSLVVLGQVQTANDADHSVFWSKGASLGSAPTNDALFVGKHVGEDPDKTRASEKIGYIALEAGANTIGDLSFIAGVTSDSITHRNSTINLGGFSAEGAVLSSAGVDGGDGGIAALGSGFASGNDSLVVTIDEDQLRDSERNHTTEQVAYLSFDFVDDTVSETTDPNLQVGQLTVGSDWQTVTLDSSYESMVVVATPIQEAGDPPVAIRIQNAEGGSFEIKAQRLDGSAASLSGIDVQFIVVEEGVYTEAEHGVNLEAVKINSDDTSGKNNWGGGEAYDLENDYTNVAVLGQVMSANDADASVFWSRGSSQSSAASSNALVVGKHIGEDSDKTRADETVGFIAVESGTWQINGVEFLAGVTGDSITHESSTLNLGDFAASGAIASQTGMDGGDGGFAVLTGVENGISVAIDEDTLGDSERRHTTEQVAIFAFREIAPALAPVVGAGSSSGQQSSADTRNESSDSATSRDDSSTESREAFSQWASYFAHRFDKSDDGGNFDFRHFFNFRW